MAWTAECPKRKKKKDKEEEEVKATNKLAMVEPNSRSLKADEAMATINGYQFPVCVDTGARISLLPKELVDQNSLTGKVIRSKMVNGITMDLEEVELKWEVESIELEGKVGVVEGECIGLLSVCFSPEEDLRLMKEIGEHKIKTSMEQEW